ncbi:MAG: hypothetical protein N2067_01310 [Spirochaetaceae bacterium]|nr:hypothetical protein [Spirochaetaceae bacterium]
MGIRKNVLRAVLVLLVLTLGIATPAFAQATVGGEVSAFSGIFFNASGTFQAGQYFHPSVSLKLMPSFQSEGLRLKGELTGIFSVEDTGYTAVMRLGEAYATLDLAEGLSFTAGSRIISWGTALVSNPENFINPVDVLGQLVSENRSDWLLPVILASAKYIRGPFSIEAVALPFFRPSLLPARTSRWYPAQLAELDALDGTSMPPDPPAFPGATITVHTTPAELSPALETMQGAVRAGLSLGAMDAGLSGWYGYTKTPAFDVTTTLSMPIGIDISACYRRQAALGMDLSATVFDASVVWLESALMLPEYYLGTESSGLPVAIEKPTLKAAFGVDRTFGLGEIGDLYYAIEGNAGWILGYDSRLAPATRETELGATMVAEYRLPLDLLSLRLVIMEPDFLTLQTTRQYLVRLSMKAKLMDGYTLGAGVTFFNGTAGRIGQYAGNDFAYIALTASF